MAEPTPNRIPTAESSPDFEPNSGASSGGPVAAPGGADLNRRRFFRQFAGDLASTAATMVGAAQALQRTSAELAGAILDPTRVELGEPIADGVIAADGTVAGGPGPVFRTAFRLDGPAILFVDQRALPGTLVEHVAESAAEVVFAIRNGIVEGGPAIGQAAAIGLALTAARVRTTQPYARRATLRGAANALLNSAPSQASVRHAVDRVMAAYEALGELTEDGEAIAAAMRAEADAVVHEATAEHGRLVEVGLASIPAMSSRGAAGEPLRILVHGPSGALAGGQFGTALAIVIGAHHAEREVRAYVPEGRPTFSGARVTCWELAAAGVPNTLVADAAAASLVASGEIDLILVPADHVAANGDVAAPVGTYPLAEVAARHVVPLLVCAPCSAIDPTTPDGSAIEIGLRPAADLEWVYDRLIAPRGTESRVPTDDITPASLVTAYITAGGLAHPPFAPGAAR